MRKLLVFQHVASEPLGTLDRMFRTAGFRIRYVNYRRSPEHAVAVERYAGLVVLGGPMAADELESYPHLAAERDAILEALARELPVLGICLGAQLMAAALGARTQRGAAVEKGWTRVTPTREGRRDPLLRHVGTGRPLFQWHNDTFTLPDTAEHLARSADCAHQAFRVGESAYGLQFHLEADRVLIGRWLDRWREREPGAAARIPAERRRIEADTERHIDNAARVGDALFGEFIERFYRPKRRVPLASR